MNRLSFLERTHILNLLTEGQSIRAVTRMTGVSKNTVLKLLVDIGRVCEKYQRTVSRDVIISRLYLNPVWVFSGIMQSLSKNSQTFPTNMEFWVWIAQENKSSMLFYSRIGPRDQQSTEKFIFDLATKFNSDILIKNYEGKIYMENFEKEKNKEYNCFNSGIFIEHDKNCNSDVNGEFCKTLGLSEIDKFENIISNYYHEFLDMNKILFSKTFNNYYAIAFHILHHNFVKINDVMGVTPAMALGVADHIWTIVDIVKLLETSEIRTEDNIHNRGSN